MFTYTLNYLASVLILCYPWAVHSGNFDEFNYCMRDASNPGLKSCIGKTAISFLQTFEEQDNVTLFSDLIAEKDESIASRSIVNFLDQDPVDFRGILENAGTLFSQRSLQWRLDRIYPGLVFKIGPSADSNSVAEFVMDAKVNDRLFTTQEPSTAKLLTRQYLIPMLLGFKFNLATLVPIIFAGVVLLLKKSLLLVKVAIFLSTVFGAGGAASIGAALDNGWPSFSTGHGHGHGSYGHNHWHQYQSGPAYPGKFGLIGSYQSDVLSHDPDYLRNDRKITFDKPREFISRSTPSPDRFYDFEKSAILNERNAKNVKSKDDEASYKDGWDGWHIIP